jgi:uncharacterized membrane protein
MKKTDNGFGESCIELACFTAIREFISLFSSEQKGKFKQVVLVIVPSGNGQQIGFITVSNLEELSHIFIADDQVVVYLPFSYEMGGNTVIISRENVVEIDMSVQDAMRSSQQPAL